MSVAYLTLNPRISNRENLESIETDAGRELQKSSPLRFSWCYWEQVQPANQTGNQSYQDCNKCMATFNTVGGFWETFNAMPQPSVLLQNSKIVRTVVGTNETVVVSSMMFFREGVKPEWEDPLHAVGGHLQFQVRSPTDPGQVDEYWNNLVLGIIGNTVESESGSESLITGIRIVDKTAATVRIPCVRIEVWFTKPADARTLGKVKTRLEKAMCTKLDGSPGVPLKAEIRYHSNKPAPTPSGANSGHGAGSAAGAAHTEHET